MPAYISHTIMARDVYDKLNDKNIDNPMQTTSTAATKEATSLRLLQNLYLGDSSAFSLRLERISA